MSTTMNAEYLRKIHVAAQIADRSYIDRGVGGMRDELAFLRRSEADDVVIAEMERLYHNQVIRAANQLREQQ